MAELLTRLAGKMASNSFNIMAWTDSDVDIVCTLSDGQTSTKGSVAATNYGVVEFTFSGLQAGATYTAVVTSQGLSETLYPKTTPDEGATFTIASAGCQQNYHIFRHAPIISAYNPLIFFGCGDWTYINHDWTMMGLTGWDDRGNRMTADEVAEYHLSVMRIPLYKDLMKNTHWIESDDDHQFPGSNWDNSLAQCNTNVNASYLYVDDPPVLALVAGRTGSEYLNHDLQHSASTAEPTYPAHYHAFDCGDARIIVVDCTTYKTPAKAQVYDTSTCLGTVQHEWLLAELKNTSKTWKIIISDKQFISDRGSGDGLDEYDNAAGESELILDYIDEAVNGTNTDNWVNPGCVVLFTSDRHYNHVLFDRGLLHITASLGGSHTNGDLVAGVSLKHLWGYDLANNYDPEDYLVQGKKYNFQMGGVAIATIHGKEKINIKIDTLKQRWVEVELLAGATEPSYPHQKIAVS